MTTFDSALVRRDMCGPCQGVSWVRQVDRSFPAESTAVADARRMARDFLTGFGLSDQSLDDITLIISELVTNAVVHATGPVTVILTWSDGTFHGAVTDRGTTMPTLLPTREPMLAITDSEAPAFDEHGRGLAIVASLVDRWGCSLVVNGPGKTVWFRLATHA